MIRIANLEQLMQHAGSNSSNFVILVDNDNKGSVLQINMTVVIYDFKNTPFLINKLLTPLSKGVIVYFIISVQVLILLFFLLLWPESNAYLYSYFFTVILLYEFKSLNF